MKVFQINTVCGSGSTGRVAVNLAKMLESRGDESIVTYARGQAPKDVDSWQFGSKASIYYHGIMTRLTDQHGLYSKNATNKLISKIKEYNPDIIHLHNIHGYYLNYEMLFTFLKEYAKPVVWTLHDCWSYTGHCSHYSCVNCDRWKNQCHDCPLKKDYPGSFLIDNSRNNYIWKKESFTSLNRLQIVTPSKWLKNQVEQSFFGNRANITYTEIPNGIDLKKFVKVVTSLREEYGLQNKIIILGVANVWTKQKGFDDFLQLSKLLPEMYQLVMIGTSEKQQKLINAEYNNILAFGKTGNITELVAWYSTSDVYFNSSIEETMGMTTGESICCETPVVVYNSTAVPESVGEDCGIVVEANQVVKVKLAIEEIISQKERYAMGCKKYRENFSEEKANEAYYRMYQEILS